MTTNPSRDIVVSVAPGTGDVAAQGRTFGVSVHVAGGRGDVADRNNGPRPGPPYARQGVDRGSSSRLVTSPWRAAFGDLDHTVRGCRGMAIKICVEPELAEELGPEIGVDDADGERRLLKGQPKQRDPEAPQRCERAETGAKRPRRDSDHGIRIAYVIGARPNFIKMAPVIAELRRALPDARHALIHTGQHYDQMMSDVFFEELGVLPPDYMLGVGSGTHAQQTARVMERIEPVFEAEHPDLVIVPGDVNSTLAAALVAIKLGLRIAHLEAGLRSFDRTMPEEINRIVADEFSEFLFLHSQDAIENLRAEGIADERMHFVGNTMIDSLVAMENRFRSLNTAHRVGVRSGEYLLVTLHRPALVDGPLLEMAMDRLALVARELPVVFPVHPRTRLRLGSGYWPGVKLIDPVGYLDFLSLEADAAAVLTDSGGVQEETTYLGVPCFTLRDNTERPVTVRDGTNTLLGLDPARIADIEPMLHATERRSRGLPPRWDGRAAERVGAVLCEGAAGLSKQPVG